KITQLFLTVLPWLLLLFTPKGFCNQRVNCQWGPYGDWSECDSCTKLQTRSRTMAVYAQFGGSPCGGGRTETRSCETTKGCPLEDGCGDRFRCRSGKCISQSLVCNGDQDCEEDGHDERACGIQKYIVCLNSAPPPNIELLGQGFDVVSGKRRASVINTKSFGGQCRTIYSGVHMAPYRLPLSTIQYSFLVKAQNDFSDEIFTSKWHYAKDIVKRQSVTGTTTGYNNYDLHETYDKTQTQRLLVLKNDIEVAQFQSNSPQYLPISEEFWKALAKLPSVYDYSAYRKLRPLSELVKEVQCAGVKKLYLRRAIEQTMEPQCFDQTLPQSQKCGTPPALINGYILNPKDIYLVGSRVQYTCTEGFYLVGQSTLECTADQTWSASPGLCTISRCKIESLADDVIASPLRQAYGIGETVTLSCPEGRQLLGEATSICDPSLNFSPNPADVKCSPVSILQPRSASAVQCKLWQKSSRGKCVCKMPFECSSSLELCATSSARSRKSVLLSVCKMHALQCVGKKYVLAEDSTCRWPQRNTTGCTSCHMWETCEDQTRECRCKDSADCLTPGLNVCVRVGEDPTAVAQTMSECEAGLRRCKGEKVSVVSILPCAS
ncbi:complement component C7-like protein, partial [Lates japonicus]